MTLGSPMDVFGNSVNVSGDSISQTGTIINQRDYFLRNGKLVWDTQRESIYTKELSEKIIEQYKNIIIYYLLIWLPLRHLDYYPS